MSHVTRSSPGPEEPVWATRRRRVQDAPSDLDLYLVALGEVSEWAAVARRWISDLEAARGNALRDEGRRRDFLDSRVILRHLVAHRLGCPPEDVELPRDSVTGAPRPATLGPMTEHEPDVRVHYSLARTPGYVAVAMANRPVGVDLELRQTPSQAEALLRLLHPSDQARLLKESARRRPRAVTDTWVRLEAVVKARGTGLSADPSTVNVGGKNRVRHSDGLIVTGVRTRRGTRLHAAVAWLEEPLRNPEPRNER